jgi:hypothetical protein
LQSTADLNIPSIANATRSNSQSSTFVFVVALLSCAVVAATFASWLPLQVSIVTVFLFAGPHNWFELRYFLMRLPVRFGRSRNFFLTAFGGIGVLTTSYLTLPVIYKTGLLSSEAVIDSLAIWNTLLLIWIGSLVWLRSRQKSQQKSKPDWSWTIPLFLAFGAFNWWKPQLFSLAIVYLHPIVALWFLDRHLARTRRNWLRPYRLCLLLLPVLLGAMIWKLSQTTPLADSNGLFWRITQHSGAELFPQVSSHMLVSVHLFLEMLHYGVWIFALTLIGPASGRVNANRRVWDVMSIPFARHPRGFPQLVSLLLVVGVVVVVTLWAGFSFDYSTTRDLYFTIAIAHVLAEAPFLLRMM